ncbi:hypothetical protein [Fulvitalea axinellae]|uniref:hypothetical protein n=1 Tax=Fulvitalea axinellae TaxID=1182444 RepID=UPI0030CA5415
MLRIIVNGTRSLTSVLKTATLSEKFHDRQSEYLPPQTMARNRAVSWILALRRVKVTK